MSCPFPGDLFVQFPRLQGLYLGWNMLTVRAQGPRWGHHWAGAAAADRERQRPPRSSSAHPASASSAVHPQGDIHKAARNLSALPGLQELGLYNNQLSGQLSDQPDHSVLCRLVQQGDLQMLQLGRLGLTGSLPSCLFNANSSLLHFSASRNQLEGSIPNAFTATSSRLQLLNLEGVSGGLLGGVRRWQKAGWCRVLLLLCCHRRPALTSRPHLHRRRTQNRLAGPLPPTLAALPNLSVLDVSNNSLSGAWRRGLCTLRARWCCVP